MVYITGHGGVIDGETHVPLFGEDLSESEFTEMVDKINSKVTVVVVDPCYSGGFLKYLHLSERNIIAVSSTDAEHASYGKHFSEVFWKSFLNPNADINNDGDVSVREAFLAANEVHKRKLEKEGKPIVDGQYTCSTYRKGVIDATLE